MLAYSRPITPAPITTSVRGRRSRLTASSLVRMRRPSNSTLSSRVAVVPVASTTLAPLIVWRPWPSVSSISMVWGSRNAPWPL